MDLFLSPAERVAVIKGYAQRYGLTRFIETGTSSGETTNAVLPHFESIWTIELDLLLWKRAVGRFAEEAHVNCAHGDSGEILPSIVNNLRSPVIFWLDGHYCGPGSAHGDLDTPIVAELEAAVKAPQGSVILIDDARVFGEGAEHHLEPHYRDYPTLTWVENFAHEYGFDYELKDDIVRLTPIAGGSYGPGDDLA